MTVVSALIEEKARLGEQKAHMKKQCREEKARLDAELERIQARRQRIEEEEQSAQLLAIEEEFDQKTERLNSQKKLLAQ